MPELIEGSVADIIVESVAFADPTEISRFDSEDSITLVDSGQTLLAILRSAPDGQPIEHAIQVKQAEPQFPLRGQAIPFTLEQSLTLHFRGTKLAELEDATCLLDTLPGRTAKSVNEAYTRLSEHYENWRRSHAGNVFDVVYLLRDGKAVSLDQLRKVAASEFEKRLFHLSGALPLEVRVREEP